MLYGRVTCVGFLFVPVEITGPPPVPPRRRKRKTDIIVAPKPIIRTKTSVKDDKGSLHNGSSRRERKPRSLPPPPPVPRSVIPHRTKPRITSNDYLAPASTDNARTGDPEVISDQVKLPSKASAQGFSEARTKPRFTVTQVTSIENDVSIAAELDPTSETHDNRSSGGWDYRNENQSGRSSPMPQNYSPLFFTMRDFESVMAHSSKCDRSLSQQFDTITTPDKSTPNLITAFIENSDFHESNDENNEEQVCFRVTTTNVPFEKCLGDWNVPYDSCAFDHQFEGTEDHYIFEDYMDHRQNPKLRSTAAAFLFDDNTFPNFNTEEPTTFHSATKVRFVIESPTASTLDPDTPESLSNFESLVNDDEITNKSSVIITEITETTEKIEKQEAIDEPENPDEFGDVPFSSLIGNELKIDGNSDFCKNFQSGQFLSADKVPTDGNFNNACDLGEEKNSHNLSRPRSTPSPRFMSPKKRRFDPIPDLDEILLPALPPTYDPRDEGFVKKVWDSKTDHVAASPVTDRSSCLKNSSKTSDASESSRNAKEAFLAGKLRMTSYDDLDSPVKINSPDKVDTPAESQGTKQRIFIDTALRNFIEDDEDDMDWKESSDEKDGDEGMGDSRLSNLDDRKELVETAEPKVLNRDTCQEHEVSPDKHPRPFRTADHENKECNQEKLVQDEELDVMRPSEFRYRSVKKDERPSVPVTVRRNSFLENMLVDDDSILSLNASAPCAIIATHPKSIMSESIASPSRKVLIRRIDKPSSPLEDFGKSSDSRLARVTEQKAMESGEKQLKKETGARTFGSEPKIVGTMASSSVSERMKSTGEAKIDVLSELLSNFSAIKLKSVEPRKRELVLGQIHEEGAMMMGMSEEDSAETIRSMERFKMEEAAGVKTIRGESKVKDTLVRERDSELSHEVELSMAKAEMSVKPEIPLSKRPSSLDIDACLSAKTDDDNNCRENDDKSAIVVVTSMEDKGVINDPENLEKRRNSNTHCGIKTLENRDKINVDKCAIDRNINNPQIRRNNNDNNAMTPVDLSNDQKPRDAEVSAITPGSVRSFVELYEIQHEKTSEHSKNNYSLPVAKTRTRTRCFKGLWNNVDSESTEQLEQHDSENATANRNIMMQVIKVPEVEVSKAQTLGELKIVEKSESNKAVRLKVQNRVPRMDECLHANNSTHTNQSSGRFPVAAKRRTQESCLKISNELSPRSEVKKTVTFYNDCEAKKTENETSNETIIIDRETVELDGRPKTWKRRAPARPADELGAIENRDCATGSTVKCDGELNPSGSEILSQGQKINPTPFPRSAVNLFAAQVGTKSIEHSLKKLSTFA